MIANTSTKHIGHPVADIAAALGISLDARSKSRKPTLLTAGAANDSNIHEGNRNATLASLAGSMQRRKMSPEAIEGALQIENEQRCLPPLDAAEVTAIASSITTRYQHPAATSTFQHTDVGNANRFESQHRESVRFIPKRNEWMLWDGSRWSLCGFGPMQERAKETAAAIKEQAEAASDEGQRDGLMKHWRKTETAPKLDAMLKLASSIASLVVQNEQLDSNPMLLGVANGVIDLATGALLPPARGRLMTRQSPVVFDSTADCPLFIAFINRIFAGDIELIEYIQRMFGYALTGMTTEQCFFFFYGSGANGKSTLINIMSAVVGSDYATTTPTQTLMINKSTATNDVARLNGMRMVFANELDESSLLDEQLVKQLVSGDAITARFLYKESFEFRAQLKLFIAGNHKPVIRGRDEGMWRRTKLVPFDVTIPAAERDPRLEDKLRSELPGILNWLLKGTREWIRLRLKAPHIVEDLTTQYRQEMDILGQWIEESCTIDPSKETKARDAYDSYTFWCSSNGFKRMTSAAFSRELAMKFEKRKKSDANYFIGMSLNR